MKSKTAKIIGILISVLVLFASCGQMMNGVGTRVSINLPYINNANSRAVSSDDIQRIKGEHSVYRVHINNSVLEGTGGNFSAYFPVGTKVDVFIECVNSKGEVILRTVTKSIVVSANGENIINFNLKTEGNEIIPESQKGRVIYSYGEAENSPGNKSGLPIDSASYNTDDVFEVKDGNGMTWDHGTFTGWKANVELKGSGGSQDTTTPSEGDSYLMPEGGVTLTAQWTKNTYTIHYDMNSDGSGGTQTSTSINDDTGNVALEPAQVSADTPQSVTVGSNNYTFTHWLGSDGNTYQPGESIPSMTGDITLTAQWSDKNVWTITYSKGNTQAQENAITNWSASTNVVDGESMTLPTLQATGYTFTGWQIDSETKQGGDNYRPTQSVTATAQWTVKTYTIRYNSNGGNLTPANTTVKITDSLSLSAGYGTKTGYTFSHWKDGADDTDVTGWSATQFIERMEQNSQTEIMLSAVWEATTYTIQFNGGGASGSQTQIDFTVEDTSKTLPQTTTFTNQGYTFSHWATSSGGLTVQLNYIVAQIKNGVTDSFEMTGNTITIYAVWQQSNYIISFNWNTDKAGGNDGSVTGNLPDNIEVLPSSGSATIPFPTVSRPGYTFLGWSENQTNSSAQYTSTNNQMGGISSSKTLYAVWQQTGTAITIKIQYIYGMGTGGNPSSWSEFLTGPHTDGSFSGDSKTLVLQDNTQLGYTNLGISETYQNSGTTYTFYGLYPANQVTVDGGAEVVSGMNYTTVNDNGASVKRPTDAVSADMNGQTYYAVYVQGALSDSTRKLIGTWQVSAAHDQQLQNDLMGALNGASGAKKIVFNADYTADVTMYITATGAVTEQVIPGNQWEYDGTNLKITMPGSSGSLSATLIVGSDLKTADVTMTVASEAKTYTYDKTN